MSLKISLHDLGKGWKNWTLGPLGGPPIHISKWLNSLFAYISNSNDNFTARTYIMRTVASYTYYSYTSMNDLIYRIKVIERVYCICFYLFYAAGL